MNPQILGAIQDDCAGLQNLHPRFKSGRRLQIFSSNSIACAPAAQMHAFQLDYGGLQISGLSPRPLL